MAACVQVMLSVEMNSIQSALTAPLPTPPPSAVSLSSTRPPSQSQLVNGVDSEFSDGFPESEQEQVCSFFYYFRQICIDLMMETIFSLCLFMVLAFYELHLWQFRFYTDLFSAGNHTIFYTMLQV